MIEKKNVFVFNKYIIIKKGKYYYDNIYNFLMSKKLAIKNIKINDKIIPTALDYKKLVYPSDLYTINGKKVE